MSEARRKEGARNHSEIWRQGAPCRRNSEPHALGGTVLACLGMPRGPGPGGQQRWAAADVSPWGGPADCGWLGSHSTSRLIPVHVWTAPTGAPHLPHSCALGLLPGRRAEMGGMALGFGAPWKAREAWPVRGHAGRPLGVLHSP